MEGCSDEQVFYLSERIEGNHAEVRTEVRSLVLVPIDSIAVVARPFHVENRSALIGIACGLCALG